MAPPPNIRYTANAPFPSLVTGVGPIAINKVNGVWSVAFNMAPLAQQVPPFLDTTHSFATFWNSTSNSFSKIAFSDILSSTAAVASSLFTSRAQAAASNIPSATQWLITLGFTTLGDDGGGLYAKVGGSTNGGFQSADGAWWALQPASDGKAYAKAFGAKGDNSTDDTTAINNAITYQTATGGIVFFAIGTFVINSKLQLPEGVRLQGSGKRVTTIRAGGSFPASTPMIQFGLNADTIVFDCNAWDMQVDANNVTGSICVYSKAANEGCGVSRSITKNFKDTGIFYDTGCEHFSNEDVEVYNSNFPANYGIKYVTTQTIAGTQAIAFHRITVVGNGIGNLTACVYLANCRVVGSEWHLEQATDGLLVSGDNVNGVVASVDGENMTNVVHFTGQSQLVVLGTFASFGAAHTLQDDATGNTNTVDYVVPVITKGPIQVVKAPVVTTTTYTLQETDNDITFNLAGPGTSVSLILPTPSVYVGRKITVRTINSTAVTSSAANIVPLKGGAAQSLIVEAIPGSWAMLESDGTNWVIIAGTTLPSTQTIQSAAAYTVLPTDTTVVILGGSGTTLTLYPPGNIGGHLLQVVVLSNVPVTASTNVQQLYGGAGGVDSTTILPPVAGAWAILQAKGGAWAIVAQYVPPTLPVVVGAASYTVGLYDYTITNDFGGTLTLTLPAASSFPGRILFVRTILNDAVISASSNVVPRAGGAAGTAIVTNVAGAWAQLQSDGSVWQILAGS